MTGRRGGNPTIPTKPTLAQRKAIAKPQLDSLVGIPTAHELINAVFGLHGTDEVMPKSVQMWWHRTNIGGYMALPMPEPDVIVPSKRPRAFWTGRRLVVWYAEWKGEKVPKWAQ